jgi:hypothetical protein
MFTSVTLVLAAACLLPALTKLAGLPRMRASAAHFGIAWERYRLIGLAELAAAADLLGACSSQLAVMSGRHAGTAARTPCGGSSRCESPARPADLPM